MLSKLWHGPTRESAARQPARARPLCWAGSPSSAAGRNAARPPVSRPSARTRHGHQRAGLLGEVRQLLGRGDAARADGGRSSPTSPPRRPLDGDENTIGVVAILGSTFDGLYEPIKEICDALDDLQTWTGLDVRARRRRIRRLRRRSSIPISSGTSGCRADPRSTPPATSTGSFNPGVGCALARPGGPPGRPRALGQLPRRQHADLRAQLLASGCASRGAVLQLLRLGFDGYTRSRRTREVATSLSRDRGTGAVSADHARRAPVFAFTLNDDVDNYSVFDVSNAPGNAAGSCPPTPSPRIGPTGRTPGWSSAVSVTTSPNCLADVKRQLRGSRSNRHRCTRARRRASATENAERPPRLCDRRGRRRRCERVDLVLPWLDDSPARLRHLVPGSGEVAERFRDDQSRLVVEPCSRASSG